MNSDSPPSKKLKQDESTNENKLHTTGLRRTMHGVFYQLELFILAGIRLLNQKKIFTLSTEQIDEHGKFDDIVIEYENKEQTMVQVKHSIKEITYKENHFMTDPDVRIDQYFYSWYKFKTKNQIRKMILFTNRSIDPHQDFLEETNIENDELMFENCKTMKFKKNREKLISHIISKFKINDQFELVENEKVNKNDKEGMEKPSEANIELLKKEINRFLDKFYLKLSQPNNVTAFLYNDLEKLVPRFGSKIFFECLCNRIENWFSAAKKLNISSTDLKDHIENTKISLIINAKTLEKQKLLSEKISKYSLKQLGIPDLILSDDNIKILLLGDVGGGSDYRVFITILNKFKEFEFCFLDYEDFNEQNIDYLIKNINIKLIVFDCRFFFNFKDMINKIDILKNSSKKFLLLMDKSFKTREFEMFLIQSTSFLQVKQNPFLTDDQIKQIISTNTKIINLGQKDFDLKNYFDSNHDSGLSTMLYNLDYLIQVLDDTFNQNNNFCSDLPYDVYVPNYLLKNTPAYDIISTIKESNAKIIFIHDCWTIPEKIKSALDKQKEEIIVFDEINYKESINSNESSEKKILICLKTESKEDFIGMTGLHVSLKGPHATRKFLLIMLKNENKYRMPIPICFDEDDDKKNINLENKNAIKSLCSNDTNLSIISANAGYGKSTFCSNMLKNWLEDKNDYTWVVKVVLSKVEFVKDDPDLLEIFTKKSTGIDFNQWTLEALKLDLEKTKRVKLILDGFDEIKDAHLIDGFNKWLEKVPYTTSIIITTRPYAVNKVKLPENRYLNFYYTLLGFTETQSENYRRSYIEAIIGEAIIDKVIIDEEKFYSQNSDIVEHLQVFIYDLFKNSSTKHLGVPLETYLICESMKKEILESFKQQNIITYLSNKKINRHKNTVELFQRFIKTKLELYLQKHLKICVGDDKLYDITSNSIDILMLFAYFQAFCQANSLTYDFIRHHTINKYQTNHKIQNELHDLGISSVETNKYNEFYINFNHESYQEYFSALYIFKQLLVANNDDAQTLLTNQYNLQFRPIFIYVFELFWSSDPLFPNYVPKSQVGRFLKMLFKNDKDILGAASKQLIQDLKTSLSKEECNEFDKFIPEEIQKLTDLIAVNEKENLYINELKATFFQRSNSKNTIEEIDVTQQKQLLEKLKDYKKIDETVEELIINETTAIGLLEVIKLYEKGKLNIHKDDIQWDIQGGFVAIAHLGNYFNDSFAKFIIKRVYLNASWRFFPALNALCILYNRELKEKALNSFMSVFFYLSFINLSEEKVKYKEENRKKLSALILDCPKLYFEYLRTKLENIEVKSIDLINYEIINSINLYLNGCNSNIDWENVYYNYFMANFLNLLWCASITKSAVSIDNNNIILKGDISCKINLVNLPEILSAFNNNRNEFLKIIKDNSLSKVSFKTLVSFKESVFFKNFESNENTLCILKKFIEEENDIQFYTKDIIVVFKKLYGLGLLNENLIKGFIYFLKHDDKSNRWHIDAGIECVKYTGKYFDKTCAEYLIERSEKYSDNRQKSLVVLEELKKTLTNESDKNSIRELLEIIENTKNSILKA